MTEKESAEFFPRPENLSAAGEVPAWVAGRQVKQLKRPCECGFEPQLPAGLVRANGALDLTPDMCELVYDGQLVPPFCCACRHGSRRGQFSASTNASAKGQKLGA